ncbi:MAG: ABC transporter permease, partial [Rhodopirellula sp. JB053]
VSAMTSEEFADMSINYWLTRTGLGLSFGAATALGLLVGLVMVAQTLYAMVLDRISEFATLKALGSKEGEILLLLGAQSSLVAIVGIVIGIALSVLIRFLFSTPRAEIMFSQGLYTGSAAIVFIICLAASGLPYLRVRKVDPHSILQG